MKYTLYHNPRCSKSRQALALLKEQGIEPDIRLYLQDSPSTEELEKLLSKLNVKPHEIIRKSESIYKEKFKGLELNDHEWIEAMVEYPKLIERPIFIRDNKAIVGRPPENVLDLIKS